MNTTNTETQALGFVTRSSERGQAMGIYDGSWEPALKALKAQGKVVECRLASFGKSPDRREQVLLYDRVLPLTGYWIKEALIKSLQRELAILSGPVYQSIATSEYADKVAARISAYLTSLTTVC
jgi:hypothetical protein